MTGEVACARRRRPSPPRGLVAAAAALAVSGLLVLSTGCGSPSRAESAGSHLRAQQAAPPPVASPLESVLRFPAKLQVRRAGIERGRLDVLAEITAHATGRLTGTLTAGRRTHGFEVAIPRDGVLRIDERLPAAMRRARTGILALGYAGSAVVRPDDLRLRAASRRALLRRTATSLAGGRLRVAGTISARARGVVRVRHDYTGAKGSAMSLDLRARVEDGRWSLDERLIGPAADGGHLSIQFTGDGRVGVRGEQTSKQLP